MLSIGWLLNDGDAPTFAMRLHILLLVGLLIGWDLSLSLGSFGGLPPQRQGGRPR